MSNPNPRAPAQFLQQGKTLPSLQAPNWPNGGFDPRGYQPGYTPGGKSNDYAKSTFLSLGAISESTIQFGTGQDDSAKDPSGWVLTIAPSPSDLLALDLAAGAPGEELDLFYKVEYIFDSGFPSYFEGSFDQRNLYPSVRQPASPVPVLAESATPAVNGYKQLSQRGIRVQLRGWSFKLWLYAFGNSGRAANWQNLGPGGTPLAVRFDATICKASQEGQNSDAYELSAPTEYLPVFSKQIKVPAPSGVAGATFTFDDLQENPIVTYPLSNDLVMIPARAVKVNSATPGLFAEITLY
jgi:hypothetical protein